MGRALLVQHQTQRLATHVPRARFVWTIKSTRAYQHVLMESFLMENVILVLRRIPVAVLLVHLVYSVLVPQGHRARQHVQPDRSCKASALQDPRKTQLHVLRVRLVRFVMTGLQDHAKRPVTTEKFFLVNVWKDLQKIQRPAQFVQRAFIVGMECRPHARKAVLRIFHWKASANLGLLQIICVYQTQLRCPCACFGLE